MMDLTQGQDVIIPASHLAATRRAYDARGFALGILMWVCGVMWGWNWFHEEPIIPWIEKRYWDFGSFVCDYKLAATAPQADSHFLYRCDDGNIHDKRVILTEEWERL